MTDKPVPYRDNWRQRWAEMQRNFNKRKKA